MGLASLQRFIDSRSSRAWEGRVRRGAIEAWLCRYVGRLLELSPEDVDPGAAFADLGLGSAEAVGLVGELELELGHPLPETLLYDYPNISAVCEHLVEQHGTSVSPVHADRNPR